jgi:glycogen synthase
MRILLLSNLYPPHVLGGAEIVARDFAAGLEELGHDLAILTSSYGLSRKQQEGQTWRTLGFTPAAHLDRGRPLWQQLHLVRDYYRFFHSPANVKELQRAIAEIRPDVLYIWEITGLGVNTMLGALGAAKLPVVFHLESYWWQYVRSPETEQTRLRARRLKQALIGAVPALPCTSMIAASEAVKQEYVAADCDPARIEVIYNGIDARFLDIPQARRGASDTETRPIELIYVGRLCDEKGVLVLLKALHVLVHEQGREQLHLNIFGDGDAAYIRELHAFLAEKQLASCVTFHGRVPQNVLIEHYDRSGILLAPSLWKEPFGLVIAEAMARGLPVISSNIGGPAEIITHGVDGLLAEPGDELALASTIARLVEHAGERARLSQAARITVAERFLAQKNTQRIAQHLQRAIEDYGARSPGTSSVSHSKLI